jgi:hypothetical protein
MYVRIRVLDQFFDFEKNKITIFMHVHVKYVSKLNVNVKKKKQYMEDE